MCYIARETAAHANADNQAIAEMEANELALGDLFNLGESSFSNTWLELGEVIEEALEQDRSKFLELLVEVEFAQHNKLDTYASLKQEQVKFYTEVALKMNSKASRH